MKKRILRTAYCLLLIFWPVWAYGWGIEPDDQPQQQEDYPRVTCVINTNAYSVHFSAYLQSSADNMLSTDMFLPFCQETPSTGEAHFTMDFLDRGLRRLPVAVRVVEESDDDPSEVVPASRMLVDVPAKLYPTGIIEVQAALNKPGRYAVLLTVDRGQPRQRPGQNSISGCARHLAAAAVHRARGRGCGCSLYGLPSISRRGISVNALKTPLPATPSRMARQQQ